MKTEIEVTVAVNVFDVDAPVSLRAIALTGILGITEADRQRVDRCGIEVRGGYDGNWDEATAAEVERVGVASGLNVDGDFDNAGVQECQAPRLVNPVALTPPRRRTCRWPDRSL
jgi:hypothetical protein